MGVQIQNTNAGTLTFKPPASGSLSLTMPSSATAEGYLRTNGAGALTFTTGGSPTGFLASENTSGTNATINVSAFTAVGTTSNVSATFKPIQTGGIQTMFLNCIPDGSTATGGNARSPVGIIDYTFNKASNTRGCYVSGSFCTWNLGGLNNSFPSTITSSNYCAIIGGLNNSQGGTSNSSTVMLGGSSNVLSQFASNTGSGSVTIAGQISEGLYDGCLTIGGFRAINHHYGGLCVSAPTSSSTNGSNQFIYSVGGHDITGDATPVLMQCGGAAVSGSISNWALSPNASAVFTAKVIAKQAFSNIIMKCWLITGTVRNTSAGVPTLVGTPTVTVAFSSAGTAAWAANTPTITTKGANTFATVNFPVQGAASTFIGWAMSADFLYAGP